jgi:hypothetical protein
MGNNEYNKPPNPGCVHLLVHFDEGVRQSILNIDLDWYSYFYFVDDINGLATDVGYEDASLSVALSFFILLVSQETPLKMIQMFLTCLSYIACVVVSMCMLQY